jgi:hypothetical protein
MNKSSVSTVIQGIRSLHESMKMEDAYYYMDATDNFIGEIIRFSSNIGVGSVSFYDLFSQKEYTELSKASEINDIHHRTAAFVGICSMEDPKALSILPESHTEEGRHDTLVNHIRKNIDTESLSSAEAFELDDRLDELASYKGNMPSMVIKLWQARNAMGERLGMGEEVDKGLMKKIDDAWRGFVSKKPAVKNPIASPVAFESSLGMRP